MRYYCTGEKGRSTKGFYRSVSSVPEFAFAARFFSVACILHIGEEAGDTFVRGLRSPGFLSGEHDLRGLKVREISRASHQSRVFEIFMFCGVTAVVSVEFSSQENQSKLYVDPLLV